MMYLELLECAYAHDLAVARSESRQLNLVSRQSLSAFKLSERMFMERYRLSKDLAHELILELTPLLPPSLRSDALDAETKILIALSFYASGCYQTSVGGNRRHCVAQSSVSKAIRQVTMALNKPSIINKYISFPLQQHEREQVMREFYRQYKMPRLLACVNGTHVAIVRPRDHEERFVNRKGYHSLNIFIMCDSKLNILCIDSSYPGSTHDSVIWARHALSIYLNRNHRVSGEDVYVLGDSGYSLTPNTDTEEFYQNLHLRARFVVKRCIGVLKARFRCLLVGRKLHYSPKMAAKIANACCILHNIAHRANVPYNPLTPAEAARELDAIEGASCSAVVMQP